MMAMPPPQPIRWGEWKKEYPNEKSSNKASFSPGFIQVSVNRISGRKKKRENILNDESVCVWSDALHAKHRVSDSFLKAMTKHVEDLWSTALYIHPYVPAAGQGVADVWDNWLKQLVAVLCDSYKIILLSMNFLIKSYISQGINNFYFNSHCKQLIPLRK